MYYFYLPISLIRQVLALWLAFLQMTQLTHPHAKTEKSRSASLSAGVTSDDREDDLGWMCNVLITLTHSCDEQYVRMDAFD